MRACHPVADIAVQHAIAINVASYFAQRGERLVLMDYDPQGSSAHWLSKRQDTQPHIALIAAFERDPRITRSFQLRMKDQSVTVLSVSPGLVKTDLTGGRGEIDVPTACKGVVDLVLKFAGTRKHGYYRYDGEELPW